ncbi:MAG: glycosyltransferase family 4 protein [Candidatus Gracilibacteria bacterium]|nr:glycosyltransferase family 4 protein [Candidatus Gracilibacteria bacterium]
MTKKINIIQFLPYFPPHKGGVETVGQEIGKYWCKKEYGSFINVVFDVGQENKSNYELDGYKVHLLPSFDIIANFPFPKFWKKQFWVILKELKELQADFVFTHTRFFLSSFIGGKFATKNSIKWVHIEHGSDYVKLGSKLKSKISYIYDKSIGNWIFKRADKLIAISSACKKFILTEFIDREIGVIYRGLDIELNKEIQIENLKNKFDGKIIIGFVGRLLKWKNVDSLVNSYYLLNDNIKDKIQIVIVGDGEELNNLRQLDINNKIYFTGGKSFKEALLLQLQFDIHFHTSSPGGGLATTLLQAMYLGCFIIATPYEGADEVIINGVNGILIENDSVESIKKGIEVGIENIVKKSEYSEINKKIINEKFDWNRNIEKIYEILNNI